MHSYNRPLVAWPGSFRIVYRPIFNLTYCLLRNAMEAVAVVVAKLYSKIIAFRYFQSSEFLFIGKISVYNIYCSLASCSLVPSPLPAAIFNGARKVVRHILVEKLGIRKVRQRHHVTRRPCPVGTPEPPYLGRSLLQRIQE